MIHHNQSRSPDSQNPDENSLFGVEFPCNSINSVEQDGVRQDDGESLEEDGPGGFIIEAVGEVYNGGVNQRGEEGKEIFEVREEWWVVKGPWASLVGVPAVERKGMSNSKPVPVNLEICAVVGWD